MPEDAGGSSCSTTRSCWPPPSPVEFHVDRREPGRVDVLHDRHHRATRRASSTRHRSTCLHTIGADAAPTCSALLRARPRSCRSCRCSTPTPGACPTPAWRPAPTWSCPAPTSRPPAARRAASRPSRSPSRPACPPSGWACCPTLDGPRHSPRCAPSRAAARRCPEALSEALPRADRPARSSRRWGMTETSPLGVGRPASSPASTASTRTRMADLRATQRPARCSASSSASSTRDAASRCRGTARAAGELQAAARGSPRSYYNDDRSRRVVHRRRLARTGDVATIDAERLHPHRRPHQGRHQVRRRVDLLGRARERDHGPPRGGRGRRHRRAAPAVAERPLACVVVQGRARSSPRRSCSSSSSRRVAKWWLPDDVVFIEEVPKTSVGKFSKKDLRDRFADHKLPGT